MRARAISQGGPRRWGDPRTSPGSSRSVVFFIALALSMAGLAYSMRELPVGTSYAVRAGIGTVITVVYAMTTGDESVSPLTILFLAGIVGSVIGLNLTH